MRPVCGLLHLIQGGVLAVVCAFVSKQFFLCSVAMSGKNSVPKMMFSFGKSESERWCSGVKLCGCGFAGDSGTAASGDFDPLIRRRFQNQKWLSLHHCGVDIPCSSLKMSK